MNFLNIVVSTELGMLAITALAGQPRPEFVYARPKIHSPSLKDRDGRPQVTISVPQNIVDARFTKKLDGTAIIFYPLTDAIDEIVESLPRTQLQPILAQSRRGREVSRRRGDPGAFYCRNRHLLQVQAADD